MLQNALRQRAAADIAQTNDEDFHAANIETYYVVRFTFYVFGLND
jgi:hypothetical protein